MRHTKSHTGNRRSHHALSATKSVRDAASGALRLPHRLDETTGMYRGKQVFTPKVKKERVAETKHEHAPGHTHMHPEEQVAGPKGAQGIVGKIAEATRPRSRSGMGGGA